jgi:hypothetical protein
MKIGVGTIAVFVAVLMFLLGGAAAHHSGGFSGFANGSVMAVPKFIAWCGWAIGQIGEFFAALFAKWGG